MYNRFLALLAGAGLILAASATIPAHAQEASVAGATAPFLPSAMRLSGLSPVYQQINRCSAAALTMQLSYFQWDGNYDRTIHYLNPHSEDMAVRLDEMASFAELQGLRAVARTGGTVQLLKELVASGFPVLVENSYFDGADGFNDWMGHNRVIMGYNDADGVLLSFDSLLGNGENNQGRPIPYDDMDSRWRTFNRDYLVLYRPEDEGRLQEVLGDQWDTVANAEFTLRMSESEIQLDHADGFTYFNMGSSLVDLGRFEEAAAAFDQAFEMGLPWRMLWYQYAPFEAYFQVGRYDDVIRLANETLSTTHGVEEMYYYLGLVYEQLGDMQRAEGNMEAAIWRNENYTAAIDALARMRGEPTPTPEPGT
ncbi:MAG: tetratricopeptide repeat protein [Anaerolineae bacterium]